MRRRCSARGAEWHSMTKPSDFIRSVAAILDRIEIPYHLGGSMASSVHGAYRATADLDFVIEATREQLEALVNALAADYYVSRDAMREARHPGGMFNAIHLDSSFKIDFFVIGNGAFDREEMRRAISIELPGDPATRVRVKSAEDTILRKLEWFRRGGETSEQQWRDVLGVLGGTEAKLDEGYLDRWGGELGVTDLLDRARKQIERI